MSIENAESDDTLNWVFSALSAILKLSKKSIVDKITLGIAVVVLGLAIFTNIPLFVYVIVAGFIGYFVNLYKEKKNKEVK